jgi:hypothetical protein
MTYAGFLDLMLLRTLGIHQARACRARPRTPEVTARHRAVLPRIQALRQWLLAWETWDILQIFWILTMSQ